MERASPDRVLAEAGPRDEGRQAAGRTRWDAWVDGELGRIRAGGLWREPRRFDAFGPRGRLPSGREVVSFASNDYLGLTTHPAVVEAAVDALRRWGTGSGASRLVTGSRPVHHSLEEELAAWKGAESAVIFPTGFAANLSVLTVFGASDCRILSDELNHASIIDGCRLARAEVAVWRHRDTDHLRDLLRQAENEGKRPIVVSDVVFSMDGDVADVEALVELCTAFDALLVLDEAHVVLDPPTVPAEAAVLRVGTLSKTLGSLGGFVAGPRRWCELLVNRARPYIFTTAPTPADAAAALAALRILRSGEGGDLLSTLRSHVDAIAPGHPSPIIPVMCGSEEAALAAAGALEERGLWVPAIRPPTVPPGTSRLRVTLSAAHRAGEVSELARALRELGLL
ncbi:MAG: 8-amino-7-oxononanoate synthase [Acidimicrobiales bacterium]|nr:MAG: 8-amino-7-oxononanoate synthase [Acidimicrobiales bacterium]